MHDHIDIVGILGVVFGIAGLGFGIWEYHKRREKENMAFGFLRGLKVTAKGNANNTGDTSATWNSLVEQIDDINRRLEK